MMSKQGGNMINGEADELVLRLEHEVWQAVVRKDQVALGELFADDYLEITLDGKRVEKTEIVRESPQVDEIEVSCKFWTGENRGCCYGGPAGRCHDWRNGRSATDW
jgi:hypothetical protein